ncbi:hypothetical protein F5Y15DRAFT_222797 [Xylariaceae sp. FL0016]|nr:hypothetical protein F5Y15DRAFT_222797 [Xylariaceae sp. FL0016]
MQSNRDSGIPDPGIRSRRISSSHRRHGTNDSLQSALQSSRSRRSQSFQIQAEREREAARPRKFQQMYSVYAGLTWEALRGWLVNKWPNEEFIEKRINDKWHFDTPEALTEADEKAIANLRVVDPQLGGQRPPSPEP